MNKWLLTAILVVFVVYTLNKFKTPKGMEEPKYFFKIEPSGSLDADFVRFMQLKEGGLSRDKADSASAFPSPYRIADKKGTFYSDWHTNKGITYKTFSSMSKKLGYENNAKNFIEMPLNIWLKIFVSGYYEPFENLTTSKLINYYVSSWAWGSGVGGANSLLKKIGVNLQTMLNEKGERATLQFLVNERIKFYERLAKAKPQNEKFLQGWKNVALSFYKNFEKYAKN